MPRFTEEQVNIALSICSNDKATTGNVKKIRAFAFGVNAEDQKEFRWYLFDIASQMERDISYHKAASRRKISDWARTLNKTDQEMAASFPGCIGYTRVTLD